MATIQRCILAPVALEPSGEIDRLRAWADPIYGKVPAHVTLVFPFSLAVATDEIAEHMEQVLAGFCPVELTFDACRVGYTYAYLPVVAGRDQCTGMFEQLHTGVLAPARWQQRFRAKYRPHLTVGRISAAVRPGDLLRAAAGIHRGLLGRVTSVVLETILPEGRSRVEYTVELG